MHILKVMQIIHLMQLMQIMIPQHTFFTNPLESTRRCYIYIYIYVYIYVYYCLCQSGCLTRTQYVV